MAKIKINDISKEKDEKISEAELKGLKGGSLGGIDIGSLDSLRFDVTSDQGTRWTGRIRKWSLADGVRHDFKE